MLNEKSMLEIAEKYLKRMTTSETNVLVIIPQLTIQKPYGNIYRFNFKKYLETGDFKYSIAGNGPILVEKKNRRVVRFASFPPLEDQIIDYENGTMEVASNTYWYPDEDQFSDE